MLKSTQDTKLPNIFTSNEHLPGHTAGLEQDKAGNYRASKPTATGQSSHSLQASFCSLQEEYLLSLCSPSIVFPRTWCVIKHTGCFGIGKDAASALDAAAVVGTLERRYYMTFLDLIIYSLSEPVFPSSSVSEPSKASVTKYQCSCFLPSSPSFSSATLYLHCSVWKCLINHIVLFLVLQGMF